MSTTTVLCSFVSSTLVRNLQYKSAAELSISPSSRPILYPSSSQGSTPTGSDLVSHITSVSLMQWNSEVDLVRVAELRARKKSNVSTVVVSTGCYQARSGTNNPSRQALRSPARTACHPRARRSDVDRTGQLDEDVRRKYFPIFRIPDLYSGQNQLPADRAKTGFVSCKSSQQSRRFSIDGTIWSHLSPSNGSIELQSQVGSRWIIVRTRRW